MPFATRQGAWRTVRLCAVAFVAQMTLLPAIACPPPLPPPSPEAGETQAAYDERIAAYHAEKARESEAWLLKSQTGFWDRAESVMIARIEKVTVLPGNAWSPLKRARLVPVAWLKGPKLKGRFALSQTGSTDCGNYGGGDAPGGKPGDLIIVYSSSGKPGNKTMVGAVASRWIRDPRVLAELNK